MQDFKDATLMIAGLDQDGIGLPDRDYYLKDDGNMKELRDFYAGHVGRMLALTGMRPAETKAAVADVMRIETKIAKLAAGQGDAARSVQGLPPRRSRGPARRLAKTFPWDAYFTGLGLPGASRPSR